MRALLKRAPPPLPSSLLPVLICSANVTRFHFNTWLAIHQIMKPSTEWLQYIGVPNRGTDLYSGCLIIIQAPKEQKNYSKKCIQNADLLQNYSKSAAYVHIWHTCYRGNCTSCKQNSRTTNKKLLKRCPHLQKLKTSDLYVARIESQSGRSYVKLVLKDKGKFEMGIQKPVDQTKNTFQKVIMFYVHLKS